MRKKLSFLIALAISLGVTTTSFAATTETDTYNSASNVTNSVSTDSSTLTLTLGDALNGIENSNTELKLMKDKIDSLNKQYDLAHKEATSSDTNLQANLQQVTALKAEQSVKDQKNSRDERLSSIKFDIERQYMNVLTCGDQIDNINKTIANIDEQIQKLQAKISVGQATLDSVNSLNVQKSQLLYQIDDIKAQINESLLIIKQYLNLDLNLELNLVSVKKDFAKYDDTDIANKINQAVQKDYSISKIEKNIDITKQQKDIYFKYSRNSVSGEVSATSTLATLKTSLINTNVSLQSGLWSKYYTLKSKENAVETQVLSEESAKVTYDKAKVNYDVGMTDKMSLDSASLALDKQRNLTQRAVNEYMVTQEEFKYMLDGHASAQTSSQSMGDSSVSY